VGFGADPSGQMPSGPELDGASLSGDQLVKVLATLANPHRMRVIAALVGQRNYVSELARELRISRALLQMHLRKLESAGLVRSQLELSDDGKAMKFYEITSFLVALTPQSIAAAAPTLTVPDLAETTDDGGE
jgi:predicted transcriptional regulator